MLSPDTILQNRYRIVRKLSAGGMGTVYEAIDLRFNSQVALKETHFTEEALRKQFEREAHLLYKLRHPAIARVIDHFTEGDGQYLVMDFIEGDDLWEMLQNRDGVFPVDNVLRWADQLLDALDYLHSQEPPVIHRDIKPQNLKITGRNQIILLDFGLAKGFAGQISRVTASGSIFGYTPNYAPLEQIRGTGTNERSDLYSLGATLYHLITGVIPPDALSRATAIMSEQADPLCRANEINSAVPALVADVLHQAMANNPAKRPASATEMRSLLSDIVQRQASAKSDLRKTVLPPTVINPAPTQSVQEQESAPIPPTVADVATGQENLSETQKLQLEYWTEFRRFLKQHSSPLTTTKPLPQYWYNFYPFGRSGFRLSAYAGMRDKWIGVEVVLHGQDAKPHFYQLNLDKESIESEIGTPLEWRERPTGKESYITLKRTDVDPNNRIDWPHQHQWLAQKLETFHKVFAPKIQRLDVNDYSQDKISPTPSSIESKAILQEPTAAHASPAIASPSALQSAPSTEPVTSFAQEVQPSTPPVRPARKSNRLTWIIGSIVALLVIGVVITIIYNQSYHDSTQNSSSANPSTPIKAGGAVDPEAEFDRQVTEVDKAPARMAREMASKNDGKPLESGDVQFLCLYGRALMLSGKPTEANDVFKRVIEKIKDRPARDHLKVETKLSAAVAALKTGNWKTAQAAAKELDEVIDSATTINPYLSTRSFSSITDEMFDKLIREVDEVPATMASQIASDKGGNPLDSSDAKLLYLYGRALLLSGKPLESLDALKRAIEKVKDLPARNPLKVKVKLLGVAAALKTGNWKTAQEAAKELDEVIEREIETL